MGVSYYSCGYCGDPYCDCSENMYLAMWDPTDSLIVHPDCYKFMLEEGYLDTRRVFPTIVGEDTDGGQIYFCPDLDIGVMKEKAVKCIGVQSEPEIKCTDPEAGWFYGKPKKSGEKREYDVDGKVDTFEEAIKIALFEKGNDDDYVHRYTPKYYEDKLRKTKETLKTLEKEYSQAKKRLRLT